MSDESKIWVPDRLANHESGLRRLRADASAESYHAYRSLAEAQAAADGVVVLQGDDGGQIYVVVRADLVRCNESTLQQLLSDLDAREWMSPDMAHIYYERRAADDRVPGGLGGGAVTPSPWIHPRLEPLRSQIEAVLAGLRGRIAEPAG